MRFVVPLGSPQPRLVVVGFDHPAGVVLVHSHTVRAPLLSFVDEPTCSIDFDPGQTQRIAVNVDMLAGVVAGSHAQALRELADQLDGRDTARREV